MNSDKNQLLFLISQPRSGSTLLQAILGSHSEIHTTTEPWIALAQLSLWRKGSCEFDYNLALSHETQSAFFEETGIGDEYIQNINREYLQSFYDKALEGSGKYIFLDKTPRYYEILAELHATFPEAHFILLHRNPVNVFKSILQTWVKDEIGKLFYYQRDLLLALEKINQFAACDHSNVTSLSYEELLHNPEKTIEQVCFSIGVPFESTMLQYRANNDWRYGDNSIRKYSTVTKKRGTCVSIDSMSTQHQQLLKLYVQGLSPEQCSLFGYPHDEMVSQVHDIKIKTKTRNHWNMIMGTQPFLDFNACQMELLRAIESSRRIRKMPNFLKSLKRIYTLRSTEKF